MQSAERLADILQFKREVMNQVPVVSTLLAVLSMTVAAVLVAAPERGKLRGYLLVTLTIATLLLIFGTILDAAIQPAMKRPATLESVRQMQALLNLSEVVVWSVLLGIGTLFASIGTMGFVYSRRAGSWVLVSAGLIALAFVLCCVYLDRMMR